MKGGLIASTIRLFISTLKAYPFQSTISASRDTDLAVYLRLPDGSSTPSPICAAEYSDIPGSCLKDRGSANRRQAGSQPATKIYMRCVAGL